MAKSNELLFKIKLITEREMIGDRLSYLIISNAYLFVCNKNLIYFKNDKLMEVARKMNENVSNDTIDKINFFFSELTIEEIRNIIYEILSGKNNSPKSFIENSSNNISELVNDLLEIDDSGHIIMDFGSGTGNFLANVYRKAHEKKLILKDLCGIELNVEQANISKMALFILSDGSVKPEIIIGNALEKVNHPYTRAYVFPPFGMKKLLKEEIRKSFLFDDVYLSNKNTPEWLFIDNMLSGLSGKRAVALVTGKALFNSFDIEYRNKLINSGLIEGIIELPAGSLSFTAIKVYMIVFSKGNTRVKFVDASEILEIENKKHVNLALPINKIEDIYYSNRVKTKESKDLINIPNLCPSKILLNVRKLENGVELGNLANIFTGNQYTQGIFESKGLLSDTNTGYKILSSSDIESGMIHWESLRSIDIKDDRLDKYAIHFGDVIITSKSSKVKIVVADIEPKEKVIVIGGMLIVRPNQEKLNPTYLKMFLDSEFGQYALKSIQKGSIIVTITASCLSTVEIPLISLEKQNEKAERYNTKLSTLAAYKQEIERIENSLKNLFVEEED
ncbi:MAG: N-6 DNA methylase [Bacilli bacterium]